MKTVRWYCDRAPFGSGINIFAAKENASGCYAVAQPIEFVESERDLQITTPVMGLSLSEAQNLMDELWQCGLRPSEGTGSAGSLAATQNHLKDMQTIAFQLLDSQGRD